MKALLHATDLGRLEVDVSPQTLQLQLFSHQLPSTLCHLCCQVAAKSANGQHREEQSGQGAKINGELPRGHHTPPHLSVSNAPMADPFSSRSIQSYYTDLTERGGCAVKKAHFNNIRGQNLKKKKKERKLVRSPAERCFCKHISFHVLHPDNHNLRLYAH